MYVPWAQNNNFGVPVAFVIRTAVDPSSLVPAVREALRRIDASLPLRRAQPLDVFVSESTAPERFRAMVLGIIAMLGLVLAAVGISGVTYRGVIDRTREFAVRLALGSEPGGGGAPGAGRVAARSGASARSRASPAAWRSALLLARSLENVAPVDAITTGAAIAVIAAVGIAAALLPALRIMRVQPAEVLRS